MKYENDGHDLANLYRAPPHDLNEILQSRICIKSFYDVIRLILTSTAFVGICPGVDNWTLVDLTTV